MVKMNKCGLLEELAELGHMGGSRDGATMAWSPAEICSHGVILGSVGRHSLKRPSCAVVLIVTKDQDKVCQVKHKTPPMRLVFECCV